MPYENGEELVDWGAGCKELLSAPGVIGARVGSEGLLVVTTRRLCFLAKSGLFSKTFALLYSCPLEQILGVSTGKFGFNDKLIVLTTSGTRQFVRPHVESLAPKINQAVLERKSEADAERKNERIQVSLDFSSLKTYMEKGGLSIQAFKCTNCGAPLKLPESGKTINCLNCGMTHYVQDIFEKIRQLI